MCKHITSQCTWVLLAVVLPAVAHGQQVEIFWKDGNTWQESQHQPLVHAYYVEDRSGEESIALKFSGPGLTAVAFPPDIPAIAQSSAQNSLEYLISPGARTRTLEVVLQGPDTSRPVQLYIARRPIVHLPAANNCVLNEICVIQKTPATITVNGHNLDEIDAAGNVILANGQPAALTRRGGQLEFQLPADHYATNQNQPAALKLRSVSHFMSDGNLTREVTLTPVRVQVNAPPRLAIQLGTSGFPTLYVGQTIVTSATTALSNEPLTVGLYSIEEVRGEGERRIIGLMEVLEDNASETEKSRTARIYATTRTLSPSGQNTPSYVAFTQNNEIKYRGSLRVDPAPKVIAWTVLHPTNRHSDQALHPTEQALLTFTGENLLAFNTVTFQFADGPRSFTTTELLQGAEIRHLVSVPDNQVVSLPVLLQSSLSRDTTIYIPVAQAQQPRELDFVDLTYNRVSTRARLSPRPLGRVYTPYSGSIVDMGRDTIRTNTLHGLQITFSPEVIEASRRYGVQYLVISAALFTPEGEKLEEDSARVAVVPRGQPVLPDRPYRAAGGFAQRDLISLDEMIKRLGRFSQPRSYVNVTVRHDSTQYNSDVGYPIRVRIENSNRFRIRPQAQLLTGAFYLARVRDRATRQPANNGFPADSIIDRPGLGTRIRSFAFATAAGIDIATIRADGRPGLFHFRLGVLAVDSPFDEGSDRQAGVSLLYPIELVSNRGNVDFSISFGAIFLSNGRVIPTIAPGFTLTL